MSLFKPELETCPICGSSADCHIHDYYGRHIIDFNGSKPVKSDICVLRVFCDSCKHAHAVLPDILVPYSSYSLFFILRLLAEYFSGLYTNEKLCERFGITLNQLYKWIDLWHNHKEEWLGILEDAENSDRSFLRKLLSYDSFSSFSMHFFLKMGISFLQSHANPLPVGLKNARYHPKVFASDLSIF